MLYFVIADLGTINVMYQFSLAWFQEMFDSCLVTNDNLPGQVLGTLPNRIAVSVNGIDDADNALTMSDREKYHKTKDFTKHLQTINDR